LREERQAKRSEQQDRTEAQKEARRLEKQPLRQVTPPIEHYQNTSNAPPKNPPEKPDVEMKDATKDQKPARMNFKHSPKLNRDVAKPRYVDARTDRRLPGSGEVSKLPMERPPRSEGFAKKSELQQPSMSDKWRKYPEHQPLRKTPPVRNPVSSQTRQNTGTPWHERPVSRPASAPRPQMTREEIVAEAKRPAVTISPPVGRTSEASKNINAQDILKHIMDTGVTLTVEQLCGVSKDMSQAVIKYLKAQNPTAGNAELSKRSMLIARDQTDMFRRVNESFDRRYQEAEPGSLI